MKAGAGLVAVIGLFVLWKWLGGTGAPSMNGNGGVENWPLYEGGRFPGGGY